MGINRAMEISLSAIEAERIHMETISSNIANITTTRSMDGGPYRRRFPVLEENPLTFDQALDKAELKLSEKTGGVRVKEIAQDTAPFQKVYNPSHPDADKDGFVQMPNVSLSKEMVDMVESSKLYEANVTAYNAAKKMATDTMQIP